MPNSEHPKRWTANLRDLFVDVLFQEGMA